MADYAELESALARMIALIRDRAGSPELLAQLRRLDEFTAGLGPETPPMLRHYMEKRGYPKALEFLAGLDERQRPNC
ncbi:MAG: hypothetical protein FJY95_21875 [Candidatus Handelsmanbacteria bacterium]|nr:hypothetical protein [Candidatus Handelsmanbacteria bacterium]